MSQLAKLTIKTATRASKADPVQQRREKLGMALDEQMKVVAAALDGKRYEVPRKTWAKNEHGEKVLVERIRKVRAWFFEQDGGWYVQCKYGNKPLALGKGNAVFVPSLSEVGDALNILKAAVQSGELDDAISKAVGRRGRKLS